MRKESIILMLVLAMAVLQISLAPQTSATNAYIRPSIFIFNVGYVENQINVIEDSIELMNKDSFPVVVEMTAEEGLEDMTYFPENSIILQPNETMDAYFMIFIPDAGYYQGLIRPTYSKYGGGGIPNGILSAEVTITASPNGTAVNSYRPREFSLLSPQNGYTFSGGTINLTWEEATDPDENPILYYYMIDNNDDFSSPEYSGRTLNTNREVDVILGETAYYWRVIATDGIHNRTSTETWTIVVEDIPSYPNGSSDLIDRIEELERQNELLRNNITALWEDNRVKWDAINLIKDAICYLFNHLGIPNPFWSCGPSVVCSADSDCGSNGFVGSTYCMDNDVYQDFRTYTCNNPGEENSYCSDSDNPVLVEDCQDGCSNGQCIGSISCYTNSNCGTDGYVGSNYCQNSDVYRDFRTFTCNNPGEENSYCSDSDMPMLQEECEQDCTNGECVQGERTVIFRTNAVEGDYKYGKWIAYDIDGDGDLDGMLGRYKTTIECETCVLTDYFGKCLIIHDGIPMIKLEQNNGYCMYREYNAAYYGAETSLSPTEPYASNHQEVYS